VPAAHGEHSSVFGAAEKEPALQLRIGAAPPAQKWPSSHAKHSGSPLASDTLPYVPGGQLAGSSMVAPSGQKLPLRHALQAVAPVAFVYVPEAHSSHRPSSSSPADEPALHSCASDEPSGQKLPRGQLVHSSALPS